MYLSIYLIYFSLKKTIKKNKNKEYSLLLDLYSNNIKKTKLLSKIYNINIYLY